MNRRKERNDIKKKRIEYLARQGLSNAEITNQYRDSTPAFIAMIADRVRREMELEQCN